MPRSRRLYRDLVSLQVPEEQVLSAALQEKLAMLPPQPRAPPPKVKEGMGTQPRVSSCIASVTWPRASPSHRRCSARDQI